MNNKRKIFLMVFLLFLVSNTLGYAQSIMYVPFDNRPVSLDYMVDTVEKGGFEILVPPEEYLANRTQNANPELLWKWVFAHANEVDSIVVSSDALIYGGLVASRTHDLPEYTLSKRIKNFQKLKELNSSVRIYVFSTIMRSPHASSGGVEPLYYETYGPDIFQITALKDKQEVKGLTKLEEQDLKNSISIVPQDVMDDWLLRRGKNFKVNAELIDEVKKNTFSYLLLGRDDASPYSRSHQEYRWLEKNTVGLPASKFLSFPGADQLGLVMLARAANDLRVKIPSIAVKYTQGAGEKTIPSYEDTAIGRTVRNHIIAAGGMPLLFDGPADIILAINTPVDGWTREAGGGDNPQEASPETYLFVKQIQSYLRANKKVAVADIAFANGSDNSFMNEMTKYKLIPKLESYSGWNTASNTVGYTIGQAIFAQNMTTKNKDSLMAVRLLDEWAYQANIRTTLRNDILLPQGYSDVQLNEMTPQLITETEKQMNVFKEQNLSWFPIAKIHVSFPWNRLFEVGIKLQ
ncbi:DUF4127 family protein [Pelosinus sp. sgz500959]|uniref:DUF4127 family protein n=1 Tax=Pelosinus sp. sgz500959 TaxID=3242472 RepID=UPI00366ED064